MLKEVLEILDVLDHPQASGSSVAALFAGTGEQVVFEAETIEGDQGSTDFVKVVIAGHSGKAAGGAAPTLGITGRHGGSGARPHRIGLVSDGDGAAAALAAALKLARMRQRSDTLAGDVVVTTHVCPDAPVIPHEPVEFMGSPVGMEQMNRHEVGSEMDAILSIDTTRGNRVLNHKGIAISPTVCQGWILRVSPDLVSLVETVSGVPAVVLPLSMADITPYGNGVYHLNSILQPATATEAPVVGVAITAAVPVAGSATGASHETDIALAARFSIEVAKAFGAGKVRFLDQDDFRQLINLYGEMRHLQTLGRNS